MPRIVRRVVNSRLKYQELTHDILGAAFEVHNYLGFGFLEKVYQEALFHELCERGLKAESEMELFVSFKGKQIGRYIADLVVENVVILELKAVKQISPIHEAQLVNYLKATGIEVGLLINFGPSVEYKRKILDQPFSNESRPSQS